ncbi:hypothetical protein ES703_107109 [subsurface metagenome]
MPSYWLPWSILTIFKGGLLTGSIIGAIGGILHLTEFWLLAILFIPFSIWLLYDFSWQLLVPLIGGRGNRLHKPSDTPMYMGLAPSFKEAKELKRKGYCIIWE